MRPAPAISRLGSPESAAPAAPADGRVERAGRLRLSAVFALCAATLFGCGGSGSTETGGPGYLPPPLPPVSVSGEGRVALGSIAGATVQIFRVGEYAAPLITTVSSTGAAAEDIGRFSFTLENVPPNAMFLFVASGGVAHDEDEDGVLDGPTPCLGKVHALASAAQIAAQEIRLTAVTDVVYHRTRYALQARYDDAFVAQTCDAWASFVLRSDVTGDQAIDNRDALAYDPLLDPEATFRGHHDFVGYVSHVLSGSASTPDAVHLSEEEINLQVLPIPYYGIDLVGNLAYVCAGSAGLDIWNVSDSTHFQPVARYDTRGVAGRVQVVGDIAYVADGDRGLLILDVSNPATPVFLGSREFGDDGWISDLHVVGNLVYLSNSDADAPRLYIVDVTTPTAPTLLSAYAADYFASVVRVHGSYAYLREGGNVEVVDVTDPTLPTRHGFVEVEAANGAMDVALGHLFVAAGWDLQVLSLAAPGVPPAHVATLTVPTPGINGLRILGTQAVLATSSGLSLVDVADPANPTFLGLVRTSAGVIDVDREGNLLMLTGVNGAFGAVAAGRPAPSGVVASVPLTSYVNAIDATPNRLYLATTAPNGLAVYDTANPLAPALLGSAPLLAGDPQDVVVDGPRAFVAEASGLQIYDVSNPSAIVQVDGADDLSSLRSLAVGPGVVYASNETRLGLYDVSTPADIHFLGSLPTSGEGRGLALSGSTLVLAAGSAGAFTFQTAPPADLIQRAHLDLWQTGDVDLLLPFAFVSQNSGFDNTGHLVVLDCTNLSAPESAAQVHLPSLADKVVRSGGFAYVSSWASGVNVVDVSSPADAFHAGTIPVPSLVQAMDVQAGYVYVAGGFPDPRLHVLRAATVAVP